MKPSYCAVALGLALTATLAPRPAAAFCGFYVGGADARMYNHATQVVLMRDGLRTVLSMENNYEGPTDRFAMIVPVPVVLQKDSVKTLSQDLFDRIDQLDAPRLVEYWEQDPCSTEAYGYEFSDDPLASGGFGPNDATIRSGSAPPPVQVLNRFSAGEYDIVILGAQDSLGLATWLRANGYHIPSGAAEALRPYVESGMKFFVAKVDPSKVRFERGMATLSPLRFHYDTETFSLPIRLGLLSSAGVQDLIVHVLARDQRYEVANYENVAIPTNLDVNDAARAQFSSFYTALFDHAREGRPRSIVTEYAWDSGTCDPCPTPPLDDADLAALGAEVLPDREHASSNGFVLTRMHARYGKEALGADLVFRAAAPITGGREVRDASGAIERGATPASMNNYQARYAIRHAWGGAMVCAEPRRGRWGFNPSGARESAMAAQDLAFARRESVDLASFLGEGLPTLEPFLHAYALPDPVLLSPPPRGGCAGCRVGGEWSEAGQGSAGDDEGGARGVLGLGSLFAAMVLRGRRGKRSSLRSSVMPRSVSSD